MVSVSSVDIGGTGYFRGFPDGQNAPNASIAHYQKGPITTTGATLTLGPSDSPYDLQIRAYAAPASIVCTNFSCPGTSTKPSISFSSPDNGR